MDWHRWWHVISYDLLPLCIVYCGLPSVWPQHPALTVNYWPSCILLWLTCYDNAQFVGYYGLPAVSYPVLCCFSKASTTSLVKTRSQMQRFVAKTCCNPNRITPLAWRTWICNTRIYSNINLMHFDRRLWSHVINPSCLYCGAIKFIILWKYA